MNWLCNPTGKEGGFCGVDWLVEQNNLYTKVSVPPVVHIDSFIKQEAGHLWWLWLQLDSSMNPRGVYPH